MIFSTRFKIHRKISLLFFVLSEISGRKVRRQKKNKSTQIIAHETNSIRNNCQKIILHYTQNLIRKHGAYRPKIVFHREILKPSEIVCISNKSQQQRPKQKI